MEAIQTWTAVFRHNIIGSMPPTADLFNPDVFYVSDGFDTSFGAMRLRKISLETGEELAGILTRDGVRCICENEESIYAALDKRILKLNRKDFRIEESYTKNVPRYSDYVDFATEDALISLNFSGKSMLQQFDLQQQKSSRKKIGSDFCIYHAAKAGADCIYIFAEQEVLQYSPKTNTIKKLIDTEPCRECIMDSSGKIYLLCTGTRARPRSSRILVYSALTDSNPEILYPGCVADRFWLSEEMHQLYMAYDNKLWIYSMDEKKIIFHHIFKDYIFNIFAKTNTILTYESESHCMTCYQVK